MRVVRPRLTPVPPPSLAVLRQHVAACPKCRTHRYCLHGVVLTRKWLSDEAKRRDSARPGSPH
jgi:hypothetical protein